MPQQRVHGSARASGDAAQGQSSAAGGAQRAPVRRCMQLGAGDPLSSRWAEAGSAGLRAGRGGAGPAGLAGWVSAQ
jgi:hypothetical protein